MTKQQLNNAAKKYANKPREHSGEVYTSQSRES